MNAKTIINAKNKLISETEQMERDTMLRSILVFFVCNCCSRILNNFFNFIARPDTTTVYLMNFMFLICSCIIFR